MYVKYSDASLRRLRLAAFAAAALTLSAHAFADTVTRSLCIYDPTGANRPIFHTMERYAKAAEQWGVHFNLVPYNDEDVVAADFKSGKCDAVGLTGWRNLEFVKFAGSLDMVGGLQTYDELHKAIEAISAPKAAPYMTSGNYETVGVVPGGKLFLFARHRENLTGLQKAAGKKAAVLSYDKQAYALANDSGVQPVPATIATFGPMFNNGAVEYAYAPSFAYRPLELFKGLGTHGAIADFGLGMVSLQLDVHKDRFPVDFGQQSRTWVASNMWDPVILKIKLADAEIPDHYWEHIDGDNAKNFAALMVKARQDLWDQNWYDHQMQHMLKQIRCQADPAKAECSGSNEGGPI